MDAHCWPEPVMEPEGVGEDHAALPDEHKREYYCRLKGWLTSRTVSSVLLRRCATVLL
jgi:hypothetical protein